MKYSKITSDELLVLKLSGKSLLVISQYDIEYNIEKKIHQLMSPAPPTISSKNISGIDVSHLDNQFELDFVLSTKDSDSIRQHHVKAKVHSVFEYDEKLANELEEMIRSMINNSSTSFDIDRLNEHLDHYINSYIDSYSVRHNKNLSFQKDFQRSEKICSHIKKIKKAVVSLKVHTVGVSDKTKITFGK